MLRKRKIGIPIVCANFKTEFISESVNILNLTEQKPPPTIIKTGKITSNNDKIIHLP